MHHKHNHNQVDNCSTFYYLLYSMNFSFWLRNVVKCRVC